MSSALRRRLLSASSSSISSLNASTNMMTTMRATTAAAATTTTTSSSSSSSISSSLKISNGERPRQIWSSSIPKDEVVPKPISDDAFESSSKHSSSNSSAFHRRRGREVNGSVGDCIFRKRSVLDDHHKGGGFGRPFHSSSLLKKIAEHTTKQQEQRREQGTTAGASGASETAAPEDDAQKEQRAKGFVASLDKNIVDNVLNTRHVQNLRERLDEIKYTKEFITIDKFAELCKESGCTEKKPEEYVDIMKNAGLVIQIEDYVYLEPQNITRAVINALPGVPPRIYGVSDAELRKLNEEYDQMREKVVLAEKKAARRATQLLYGGFIVLIAQLAVFVRFTYVEFSWDVMEPISYFVGLANVIMGYMYFMYTQRDFSFGTWQNQMMQSAMDRQLKTGKFDVTKYEQMARKLRRRNMIR